MTTSRLVKNLVGVRPTHAIQKTGSAMSNFWTNDFKGFRLKGLLKKKRISHSQSDLEEEEDGDEEEEDDEVVMGKKVKKKRLKGDPEFMKLTCTFLNHLCRLNILPYVWERHNHQMVVHSNRIYYYSWLMILPLTSWVNFSFVLFRFLQVLLHNLRAVQKNDVASVIPIWSALAFRSFLAVTSYSMYTHMDSVLSFTNQMFRFRKSEKKPEFQQDFPASKILSIIFVLRTIQLITTGCTKATRHQFVYSLLPVMWRNYYIFCVYVFFTIAANMTTLILIYYAAFPLIMVDTLEKVLKSKFTPFTPPKVKLLVYRQLQILLTKFHECVGSLALSYLKIYTLIISTTCAFGCIRFYDDLDVRVYMTMPISLITLIAYGYQWYGRSGKVPVLSLAAVKHMFDSRNEGNNRRLVYENRACLYSCRRLIVAKIKRQTFPSIVSFVCLQTIRMLIVSSRK